MESVKRKLDLDFIRQYYESSNPSLVQDLERVDAACRKISTFWSEYDYGHVEANGFRSFVTKCNMLMEKMRILIQNQDDGKLLQGYVAFVPALLRQVTILELVRDKDVDGPHDKTRFYFPQDSTILQLMLTTSGTELRPLYTMPGAYWLHPAFAYMITSIRYLIVFKNFSWSGRRKLLASPSYFGDQVVHMVQHMDVNKIRELTSLSSKFPVNALLAFARRVRGTITSYNDFPRQHEWQFDLKDADSPLQIVRANVESDVIQSSVKCLILKSQAPDCNTLIFHVHGSAYVTMTPADHETYLSKWCRSLNAAVVAPDYAKAPEHPFPSGLQDLLDAYLHLTTRDGTALLDFQPERVILTGDSAGGNMALALLFALNEINRRLGGEMVMPIGVCLQSPLANALSVPASGAQTCFDLVLPSALAVATASSYAKTDPETDNSWFLKEGTDLETIERIITRWTPRIRDPFFNVLAYERWEELGDIPLMIQVGEFDGLLDHATEIAKRWKGSVTLDIEERMPHGFQLMPTSGSVIVRRLQQIIYPEVGELKGEVIEDRNAPGIVTSLQYEF